MGVQKLSRPKLWIKQQKPADNKKTSNTQSEVKSATDVGSVAAESVSKAVTPAPQKKEEKAVKEPAKTKVKQPYVRANNDPRINAQPVTNLNISSATLDSFVGQPLDTSLPADINHQPRELARPANDPRVARENAQ